jgi:quinol---cytochrome c reductase iron-sulfur subunit, bacillus type
MPNPSSVPSERRGFLRKITGWLAAAVGAVVAVPGLGFLAAPLERETVRGGKGPLRVARLTELKPGRPLRCDVRGELIDAWSRVPDVKLGSCWLVKSEMDGSVRAFSTVCPHLGCGVDFDDKTGKFNCPCHTSAFDLDGRCLGGPSPRGLDELEAHVEGRDVLVRYQRFRVGTSKREPTG